jgi:DNA-binding transcriptional MerR regulator
MGDFSRATHLSVKMLRHYHEVGLLEPVNMDLDTGYRRYSAEQTVTAQIIRRFRDLEMPLEDIHVVLQAPNSRPATG